MAAALIGSVAPDFDVVLGLAGGFFGAAAHRGATHSFLGAVLLAWLIAGLCRAAPRRGARSSVPRPDSSVRSGWGEAPSAETSLSAARRSACVTSEGRPTKSNTPLFLAALGGILTHIFW